MENINLHLNEGEESKNETKKFSKRFSESDLKENTKMMLEFKEATFKCLNVLIKYNEIKSGFFDKDEGFILSVLLLVSIMFSMVIFSGDILIYAFSIITLFFLISSIYKVIKYQKRIKEKRFLETIFNKYKDKLVVLMNKNNVLSTYMALSHNSKYRRTFNQNLFKVFKNEVSKSIKDGLNQKIWNEVLMEVERGQALGISVK